MPLLLDTARTAANLDLRGRNCLTIGLVNNMPDAAWEATERQFLDLVGAASSDTVVLLKRFAVAEVPRAEEARTAIAAHYRDLSEIWEAPLDGLIVTGTEPQAADLKDEPYWPALRDLIDWARTHTHSAIWSCLAAHAAVLHTDGIVRRPLDRKLSGVFACESAADHPLLAAVGPRLRVPHSRLNDLPEPALRACGYSLLSRSNAAGADAFAREEGDGALFLYFQGHPEYALDSLLREYRRDVGRFLRGERANYPDAPHDYLNKPAAFLAEDFRTRALRERRGDLVGDFPFEVLAAGLENSWRAGAIGIYRNWIATLKARKAERRGSTVARPAGKARAASPVSGA